MPSFDVVSKVNSMEIENALNQANKELMTRFDLRGTGVEIIREKDDLQLKAPDAFKMRALAELMVGKLAKRGIDLRNVDQGEAELSPLGHARQTIRIKQGIEGKVGKEISQFVRGLGRKVTVAIQGDELRVTGKSRDDLQAVMGALRDKDFGVALSFTNFRD